MEGRGLVVVFWVFASYACDTNLESNSQNVNSSIEVTLDSIKIADSRFSFDRFMFSQVHGDSIYLVDTYNYFIAVLNDSFQIESTLLNFGAGPGEIPYPIHDVAISDSLRVVKTRQNDYYVFDEGWNFQYSNTFDFGSVSNLEEGRQIGMYFPDYVNRDATIVDDEIIIGIDNEHPGFNAFVDSDYYSDAFVLGRFDMASGKIKAAFIKRPMVYQQYQFLSTLKDFYFYYEGESALLYIGFDIDPNIYVYSSDGSFVESFGVSGLVVNDDYVATSSFEESERVVRQHVRDYTQYKRLFVFYKDKEQWLVRTYTRGHGRYGLQIYRDQEMVSDTPAPYGIRIVGVLDGVLIGEEDLFGREQRDASEFVFYKVSIDEEVL